MIHKTILAILTFVLLASPIYAQDDSSSTIIETDTSNTRIRDVVIQRQENIQQRKTAIQENMSDRKQAFQDRLAAITDKHKAQIVERVNTALANMNQRFTDKLALALSRIIGVRSNIEEKAAAAEGLGKDISTVTTALADSQTAINTADTAITSQADKDYTITINDETTLREDVMTVKNALKTDLQATKTTVVAARDAVKTAAQALRALRAPDLPVEEPITE